MENEGSFDEGLGTVYERFMLNNFFDDLVEAHGIRDVLEVPMYGMTGLTGINSVHLAGKGCHVTIADSGKRWVAEAMKLWSALPFEASRYEILHREDLSRLPFRDGSFDLVWNFASLWHVKEPDRLLAEMSRVSSNLIVVFMPNKHQVGYRLRKYLWDKEFFKTVDETWAGTDKVSSSLRSKGWKLRSEGFLDLPPWPDTCMQIGPLLRRLRKAEHASKELWRWDIMSYYLGRNEGLKEKVERFSFLEKAPIPRQFRSLLAHHRYVVYSKN